MENLRETSIFDAKNHTLSVEEFPFWKTFQGGFCKKHRYFTQNQDARIVIQKWDRATLMASCYVTTIIYSKSHGFGGTILEAEIEKTWFWKSYWGWYAKKIQVLAEMLNQKNEFRQQKED